MTQPRQPTDHTSPDPDAPGSERFEYWYERGNSLRNDGRFDDALAAYRHALSLNPNSSETYTALGNILLQAYDLVDAARDAFRHAYRLRALDKRAAIKEAADFSVLLVNTPGVVNTPYDYLVDRAPYDSYCLTLVAGADVDLDVLRKCGDVVVNLIGDVDLCRGILPRAIELIDALARPTINHPRKILATGREEIAATLAGVPHCRMPKTVRCAGAALLEHLAGFSFPVLVRVSGTHGGDEFEKCEDTSAVATFVKRKPDAEYYVTEYAPYESADGYFRKYRLIFVEGQILPYHLAISDHWKVHHFRTDMANQAWMRKEEEVFVTDPGSVFRPEHWAAMETIRQRVGLDYFGIDCALDQAGDLVVFEVNATMLVHGETGVFAYKEPAIAKIKHAFDAMLAKAARRL